MKEYHKIQTIFKRDPDTKFRTLLEGQFSLPEFEYLQNNRWVFTEKVDGTNIRVLCTDHGLAGQTVTFAGKSDNSQLPASLVSKLEEMFHNDKTRKSLASMFENGVCLYGEGYGAKIQKGGGNYRPDQDFVLFDVKVGEWWLKREDVEAVATELGIDVVPILDFGNLNEMVNLCRDGFNSEWGDFKAEGIVARPKTELKTRSGERIITKLKSKDFYHENT